MNIIIGTSAYFLIPQMPLCIPFSYPTSIRYTLLHHLDSHLLTNIIYVYLYIDLITYIQIGHVFLNWIMSILRNIRWTLLLLFGWLAMSCREWNWRRITIYSLWYDCVCMCSHCSWTYIMHLNVYRSWFRYLYMWDGRFIYMDVCIEYIYLDIFQ